MQFYINVSSLWEYSEKEPVINESHKVIFSSIDTDNLWAECEEYEKNERWTNSSEIVLWKSVRQKTEKKNGILTRNIAEQMIMHTAQWNDWSLQQRRSFP